MAPLQPRLLPTQPLLPLHVKKPKKNKKNFLWVKGIEVL